MYFFWGGTGKGYPFAKALRNIPNLHQSSFSCSKVLSVQRNTTLLEAHIDPEDPWLQDDLFFPFSFGGEMILDYAQKIQMLHSHLPTHACLKFIFLSL